MNVGEKVLKKSIKKQTNDNDNSNDDRKNLITKIQKMINMRCLARKNLDFTTADDIFNKLLRDYDVVINDRKNVWYSEKHSINGPCVLFDNDDDSEMVPQFKTCNLSFDQVQELVIKRTHARRDRNYGEADRIRTLLTFEGIELVDRDNTWRSYDGKLQGLQSNDFDQWLDEKYKH